MVQYLNITFGTESVLTLLKAQYSDRQFKLFQSSHDELKFQILDLSGQPTIFTNGLEFTVQTHTGDNDFRGLFNYQYFDLNSKQFAILSGQTEQKLSISNTPGLLAVYLLSNNHTSSEYVLLTTWTQAKHLEDWKTSSFYQTLFSPTLNHGPLFSETYLPI